MHKLIKIGTTLLLCVIMARTGTTEIAPETTYSVLETEQETDCVESRVITEPTELTEVEIIPAYEIADCAETIETEPTVSPEYQNAYEIWNRLEQEGYSEYAIAGIIGNVMAEVGGQTLDIRPMLYSSDGFYFGICQWNANAYGKVHGANLEAQIDFLINTIENEFNAFGDAFDCSFEEFKNIDDEQLAARRFAQIYERCDSSTYSNRQSNATVAYEYFANI